MKCSSSDKEDMVCSHKAVPCVDGSSLDNRQDVTLYAFTAHVRTVAGLASGDLVDFIEKDDSAVLDALDSETCDLIHVHEFLFFFLNQIINSLGNFHFPLLGSLA